jgi:hypothetical protein
MPKSCIVCSAVASPDLQLQYCDACQSAMYCSKTCQREDWKKQHKKMCKLLNVGHGGMQVRDDTHMRRCIHLKENFESNECCLCGSDKRFFKLFRESTLEGSQAAARQMKKIAVRQTKPIQKFLLFHSLEVLVRSSKSEMLSWPNSPLLVLLQIVDPDVLYGDETTEETLLHHICYLANPFNYSTHIKQLILAKQLVEHGTNVNAKSIPHSGTPLHSACYSGNVTNLDFVEYLLEERADPNAQDHLGGTPLMHSIPGAPGAAKFLLNWPTTDVNILCQSGESFLDMVRFTVKNFSDKAALPDNPEQIQHQFQLQQWRDIEEILVARGALDTGITTVE